MKNVLLSREALLKKQELKREFVVLNEAGEGVFVRQMTAKEKNDWNSSQMNKSGKGRNLTYDVTMEDFYAKLAVRCVCDEQGGLLFKPGDVKVLSASMTAQTMEKIVDVAQKLNGITEEDVEELTKN